MILMNKLKNFRLVMSVIGGAAILAMALYFILPRKAEVFRMDPIKVTSGKLYQDFKNETEANKTYSGKLLVVNGTITRSGEDPTGRPYVVLNGGDHLGEVRCLFAREDMEALGKLKTGATITLEGVCMGKVMNVTLNECSLKS